MPRPQSVKHKNVVRKKNASKRWFSEAELAAIVLHYPLGGPDACMPFMAPHRRKSDVTAAANARGIRHTRRDEARAKRKAEEAQRRASPGFKPRRSSRRESVEVPSQRTVTQWEPVKPDRPASVFNLADQSHNA